jgi:DNA polymerase-3 subunit epsilon
MIICGVDLETTGLEANNDTVTEIGAVLWDTEQNRPIRFFNKLIKIDRPVPELIVKLTGIDDALLQTHGEPAEKVWEEFRNFCKPVDLYMAHNAPFDRSFIQQHCKNLEEKLLWIDSCIDIEFPQEMQTRKLTHLAAEHGFVNPFSHRAMTDVLTMLQIASNYDWAEIIQNAKTPNVTMRAMVTFNDNQKAKSAGYRWNAEAKIWIKQIKEHKINEETLKCRDLGFLSKKVG